jgi:hypothetical protein
VATTDDALTITIEGEDYKLDDFELGDLEWLEEHIGAPLGDGQALTSMKAAVGFVYLIKRKHDPEFTLDDARKIKLNVFATPGNGNGNGKRPTKPARAAAGR